MMGLAGIVAVFAFIVQKQSDESVSPQIFSSLIVDYSKNISELNYKEAYDSYTSTNYKRRNNFEKYEKAQKMNFDYFGKLDSMRLTSGVFFLVKNNEKEWVYRGTISYFAQKKDTRFTIDVVKENGRYKISRSYPSQMTIRASADQIF